MKDSFLTISSPSESLSKEKSSKFLAYAYPVEEEEQIGEILSVLRKKHYDATHHCYAWRLGAEGERTRANDDGEPSSTAGKPILGQILSHELTNILVVVVRYFGGTKLGVSGLIAAYREAASQVIESSSIIEKTVDARFRVDFSYMAMNEVMKIIKDMQPSVESQEFDNLCSITLSVRQSEAEQIIGRLGKVEGLTFEMDV